MDHSLITHAPVLMLLLQDLNAAIKLGAGYEIAFFRRG